MEILIWPSVALFLFAVLLRSGKALVASTGRDEDCYCYYPPRSVFYGIVGFRFPL
jgi:hypothetical protein